MAKVLRDLRAPHPLCEASAEEAFGKIAAPEGRELHACLDERAVEVEQGDQAGPLSGPVGYGENGTATTAQARKNVVAILPGSRGKDELGVRWQMHEDVHSHALRGDESVSGPWIDREGTNEGVPASATAEVRRVSRSSCAGQ